MKKSILLLSAIFFSLNVFGQGQESAKKLTHTPGALSVSIWDDGFFGQHHLPSSPGSFSWNGTNGAYGASCGFGTKSANSINGIAGFGAYFIDMKNVASNFADGFTEEKVGSIEFNQVCTAVIRDDYATVPYGFDVIQKTYSVTGENVVFCRNGYINTTESPIIDLYSEIGGDLDIGLVQANHGGVDTALNLVYVNEPNTNSPYFGFVAFNNLSGCTVGTTQYSTVSQLREAFFTMTSTIDIKPPNLGDQVALIGSFIGDIPVGDTVWATFAILAGDDLAGIKASAVRAFEIAKDAGWTDKNVVEYSGDKIINVPGDYSSIQAAINASLDGDTVLVADGTYFENIKFKGKAITVASHFLIDGDKTHIDSTIINGSKPSHPDSGCVVLFYSGEDTTSVLCGFTITGGTGLINPPNSAYDAFAGGGIAVGRGAGAKIHFNKITNNNVSYNNLASGGGIIIEAPANRVVVENNYITNNKLFTQNGAGGGIMCHLSKPELILIANNVISDNQANNGEGGGIYIREASVVVRNNLIKNNTSGNAIKTISQPDPGSYKMVFVNNTVVNNQGEGLSSYSPISTPVVTNSIFWGNNSSLSQIAQELGHVSVSYSNIEGGFTGTGNIDLDPLFEDKVDCCLSISSPCIDAGDPNEIYNDLDGSRNDMGCYGGHSPFNMVTDVKEITDVAGIPNTFTLSQNYPNPFNPATKIQYTIPEKSEVTIKVYDVLGKEVKTLVNQAQNVGKYEINFNASDLSSGVYFYTLRAAYFIETRKMILLR